MSRYPVGTSRVLLLILVAILFLSAGRAGWAGETAGGTSDTKEKKPLPGWMRDLENQDGARAQGSGNTEAGGWKGSGGQERDKAPAAGNDAPTEREAHVPGWKRDITITQEDKKAPPASKEERSDQPVAAKDEGVRPSSDAGTLSRPPYSSTKPANLNVKDLTPVKALKAPNHPSFDLVRDGVAQAKVYVAEANPRRKVQVMVQELVDSIKLTSGAQLQVIQGPPPVATEGTRIVIGDCEASRAAGIDASKIPVEGFVVKTTLGCVFLVGSTVPLPDLGGWPPEYGNDGTAWAISDFLERLVGVRWYWPLNAGGRSVLVTKTLIVKPAHYTDAPVFRKRHYFPEGVFPKNQSPIWYDEKAPGLTERALPAGVDKVDNSTCLTALRQGFSWPYVIKVHDPQQIWKNEPLCRRHPDMFRKNKDGTPCLSMLCYSSQKTFDFLIAGCEAVWSRKQPTLPKDPWENHFVTWVTGTSVTVSPFDMPFDCACPACQAVLTAKDGGGAKLIGLFVKKMGNEVKRRWPDKKVMFLPYWGYEWPAAVEYPDNLVVQVPTTTLGLPRNLEALDKGIDYKITAWSKITHEKIQTWEFDGASNKSYVLFQYPHIVKAYYTRYRDLIAGSFICGNGPNDWAVFAITYYCWMKVLWNPDVDVDAIMDVFCARMFGKASGFAREFLRIECERYEKSPHHPGTGDGHENRAGIRAMFPQAVVAEMTKLWQAARQQLRHDPVALQRFEYFTWTFEHFQKAYK